MKGLRPPAGLGETTWSEALRVCEEVASRDRSNLYVVSQSLLDRRRYEAFVAMYAAMRTVDDLVDAVPDVGKLSVAERAALLARLSEWRERIEAAAAGRPAAAPLDVALSAALRMFPIPLDLWRNFIDSMRYDLVHDTFDSVEDFLSYAEGATAAPTTIYVYLLAAAASGTGGDDAPFGMPDLGDGFDIVSCGRNLGIFAYSAHILRDVARDLAIGERGRIYIPLSDIAAAGLTVEEFRSVVRSGRPDARWRALITTVAERARRHEDEGVCMARMRYGVMPPDCRFTLALIIGTYQRLLRAIEVDPGIVLQGGPVVTDDGRAAAIRDAARETGYAPPGG